MTIHQQAIVGVQWLHDHLDDPELIILDASVDKIVGKEPLLYDRFECLPNAIHCDIDTDFHNGNTAQPHSMPSAHQFAKAAGALGISTSSLLVIYDNQGVYSAPRVWWMFRAMGHRRICVLDGGLPAWKEAGHDVASQYATLHSTSYAAKLDESTLISAAQIVENISSNELAILDARSSGRFNGTAPEPRTGLRSGHIPGSINIPFADVLHDVTLKPADELCNLFRQHGLSTTLKLAASCGSGLTACIVLLAAHVAGFKQLALYDGSWSEWGADESLPIEC